MKVDEKAFFKFFEALKASPEICFFPLSPPLLLQLGIHQNSFSRDSFDMEQINIEAEDLKHLERDLNIEELTSVLFLLFGNDNPHNVVERMKNESSRDFLYDYARFHPSNWKAAVIEALTITGIFEVLQRLGIRRSEAPNRESLARSSKINPGIKLLYQLCETCTRSTAERFIEHIKQHCPMAKICRSEMLEMFLLHCIVSKLIKIAPQVSDCDFTFITNFFGSNYEELEGILQKFPSVPNSLDNANTGRHSFNRFNLPEQPADTTGILEDYKSENMEVLIINQYKFVRDPRPEVQHCLPDDPLGNRKGTEKDTKALQELFESFRYNVTVKNNLKDQEIVEEVRKATQRASKRNGLIVCILSHGHKGIIYGHNSVPVSVKEIQGIMSCKLLLQMPKILLIQACQGNSLQSLVKRLEHDGPVQSSGSVFADFLTFWSTIEGFASVRHIDNGTWFIQEMVKKIRELHRDQHLVDICTAVINRVSQMRGDEDECMLPELKFTFTKLFRFPASNIDSSC